jgi:hypothetical protein
MIVQAELPKKTSSEATARHGQVNAVDCQLAPIRLTASPSLHQVAPGSVGVVT